MMRPLLDVQNLTIELTTRDGVAPVIGGHDLPMTRPAKTVRKILNKIGLSNEYRLHTLRHTMVTRLKEFDLSAADIDRFLGKSVRQGSASHSTTGTSLPSPT